MGLRVKEECLDYIVNNPYVNREINLRFLEIGMYPYISKFYPDFFEEEPIEVIQEKINKQNDIADENY